MPSTAAFTIVQNEPVWLPIWLEHYSRNFASHDIFVLDHDSTGAGAELLAELKQSHRIQVIPVHNVYSFSHRWLCQTVTAFQGFLLQSYELVLFSEIDEIITPSPTSDCADLADYLQRFDRAFVRCRGFEVLHLRDQEPTLDFSTRPLLAQRRWWYPADLYCKPLLSRIPLDWQDGFHVAQNVPNVPETMDDELLLIHLHKLDFDYALHRARECAARRWHPVDVEGMFGLQNRLVDENELAAFFYSNGGDGLSVEEIPLAIRSLL